LAGALGLKKEEPGARFDLLAFDTSGKHLRNDPIKVSYDVLSNGKVDYQVKPLEAGEKDIGRLMYNSPPFDSKGKAIAPVSPSQDLSNLPQQQQQCAPGSPGCDCSSGKCVPKLLDSGWPIPNTNTPNTPEQTTPSQSQQSSKWNGWEAKTGTLAVGDGRTFSYQDLGNGFFKSSASGKFQIPYSTLSNLEQVSSGKTVVATITQPGVCGPCAAEITRGGIQSSINIKGNTYQNYYITGPQAVQLGYQGGYPNKVFIQNGKILSSNSQ
jgi:hypothetical protein